MMKPSQMPTRGDFEYASEPTEQIVGVAVKMDGVVCALPKPARHHHILHALDAAGLNAILAHEQGFVTDKGRYLGRVGAMQLAVDSGRVERRKTINGHELFSEDLW